MNPYKDDPLFALYHGDALEVLRELPDESVHCCVTSPPYWGLRDYGVAGQLGLEKTPDEYVAKMVTIFREVRRVLRDDGTLWLNLGDCYSGLKGFRPEHSKTSTLTGGKNHIGLGRGAAFPSGLKPKDLIGIPWRVAFALQADGWYLRCDIIWSKCNPMPESVTDRPTRSHEYLFLLSKSERYYYDAEAIKEPSVYGPGEGGHQAFGAPNGKTIQARNGYRLSGEKWDSDGTRNKRSVWTVATSPYPEAHFATYPPDLIKPCIMAGCPLNGVVLDPFAGSGTTGQVALELGRRTVLIELNASYLPMIQSRLATLTPGLKLL